jgi:hypothetical protein
MKQQNLDIDQEINLIVEVLHLDLHGVQLVMGININKYISALYHS